MKPLFESRYIESASRISHIIGLLGPALLLSWPARCKGSWKKWKQLQLTDMSEASHLAELETAGNIGVALGKVSNGLVTIDFDHEDYIESFLEANPLFRHTLRTTAQRGCNIWLRCTTEYPRSCNLRTQSGNEIGEWRADGNQTIIAGTHPSGVPYRFTVESPAIAIDYSEIVWPDVILPPDATESQRVRRVRENEVVAGCGAGAGSSSIQAFCTADLVSQLAPTDYRQNNTSLFKLARLVKSYEEAISREATDQERQFVFDRWCRFARPFWRHSRDDYYAEFLDACHYARIGLDQNPIELAVSRARSYPLPHVAGFTDERVRLLVAICREIQQITGPNPFFLPTRKLAEILGAHWTQVARWLRLLEKPLQVIHLAPGEVRRRGGSRSPRYHYGAPGQTPLETTATSPAINQLNNELARPLLNGVQLSNEPKESETTASSLKARKQ
jgi:Bifunctional DNA primase/polymerase, N-terminal